MILAMDVHYKLNYAKVVGVFFNWNDSEPGQIISKNLELLLNYVPGEFYKRELPCIISLINQIDVSILECIIVD